MKSEVEIRQSLRQWISTKSKTVDVEKLQDSTRILEERIITSVQLMDLIMYLEFLMGKPVDVTQLKPGVFNTINSIYESFFENTPTSSSVSEVVKC